MCIATVYVEAGNQRKEVMRDVVQVEAKRDGFLLFSLLGEQKYLKGKLKSIDFLTDHSVVIEEIKRRKSAGKKVKNKG